jgi:L-asparaginase II
MRERGEQPTPNHHNCSGKHTGMLANARLHGLAIEDYLNLAHPLQKLILKTFAEMVSLQPEQVAIGIDGCSAPTFGAPLRSAAHAYALLADPSGLAPRRTAALRRICAAMIANPDMVAGPARWDTLVMQAAGGKLVSKSGAEGFQAMGILPGALGPGSPALGIALKIADGDLGGRAAGSAAMAALVQLGVLDEQARLALAQFDRRPLRNWRGIEIGEVRPAFQLRT